MKTNTISDLINATRMAWRLCLLGLKTINNIGQKILPSMHAWEFHFLPQLLKTRTESSWDLLGNCHFEAGQFKWFVCAFPGGRGICMDHILTIPWVVLWMPDSSAFFYLCMFSFLTDFKVPGQGGWEHAVISPIFKTIDDECLTSYKHRKMDEIVDLGIQGLLYPFHSLAQFRYSDIGIQKYISNT